MRTGATFYGRSSRDLSYGSYGYGARQSAGTKGEEGEDGDCGRSVTGAPRPSGGDLEPSRCSVNDSYPQLTDRVHFLTILSRAGFARGYALTDT